MREPTRDDAWDAIVALDREQQRLVRDYQPVITFSASGSWVHGFRDPAAIRVAVADGAPQPAAAPAPSTGIER